VEPVFRHAESQDTPAPTVHLSFGWPVFKAYHGPDAPKRFTNEVLVLRHLRSAGCHSVPACSKRMKKKPADRPANCGSRVDRLDETRIKELFAELETLACDTMIRTSGTWTYRMSDGRFV